MGSAPSPAVAASELPSKTDVQSRDEGKETDVSLRLSSTTEEAVGEKQLESSPADGTSSSPSPELQEGDALNDYLTGYKLAALLCSTGLIFFVLLLDNSIISTVSGHVSYHIISSPAESPLRRITLW